MTDQAPADLSASSVGQLLIPVEDLAGAITFYRDRLGRRFLFTAPPQVSFFAPHQRPASTARTAATELWLTEFADPDGNHLALMSEMERPS